MVTINDDHLRKMLLDMGCTLMDPAQCTAGMHHTQDTCEFVAPTHYVISRSDGVSWQVPADAIDMHKLAADGPEFLMECVDWSKAVRTDTSGRTDDDG